MRALIIMGLLSTLLGCKQKEPENPTIWFEINAPLGPMERGEFFEDPLYGWLDQNGGEPLGGGGGTFFGGDGHTTCDFSVDLVSRNQIEGAIRFVESLGVPEGSSYAVDGGDKVFFGDRKCLVLIVDKASVDGDAFSEFLKSVRAALGESGAPLATSSDDTHEELWVYGADLEEMKNAVQPVLKSYPSLTTKPLKSGG